MLSIGVSLERTNVRKRTFNKGVLKMTDGYIPGNVEALYKFIWELESPESEVLSVFRRSANEFTDSEENQFEGVELVFREVLPPLKHAHVN